MTNNMQALLPIQSGLPGGSIESYMAYANSIPMLSEAEEQSLAKQLQENQDVEAAKKLVLSHLRFVVRVAKGYLGYGLPVADLVQEGTIGLMKAVKRFDPAVGVRLAAFAVHWIKSEIHEFILRNWRIVRIATTKAQRKLFFNLRSMKKHLGWMTSEDINGVAQELGVSAEEVRNMEARLSGQDIALEFEHEDELLPLPVPELEDRQSDPALLLENSRSQTDLHDQLGQALQKLSPREQAIVKSRWLVEHKLTLKELATEWNVSLERVRQLEAAAFLKLKEALA